MFSRGRLSVVRTIFRGIWLHIALILWIVGLVMYKDSTDFDSWIMWGFACCLPMIVTVIREIFWGARVGAEQGAHQYTITRYGSSIWVENHPIMGALIGIGISIFLCLLIGPIVLGILVICNLIYFIIDIVELSKRSH